MTRKDPNIIPAEVGREYLQRGVTGTVEASCGSKDGFWACLTHAQSFAHNLAKDSHCADGQHVLAWVCAEHGPEVP